MKDEKRRRKRIKELELALEKFALLCREGPDEWPDEDDLRHLAGVLKVPYVLLLLDFSADEKYPRLTLADLEDWANERDGVRVLREWLASSATADKAVA